MTVRLILLIKKKLLLIIKTFRITIKKSKIEINSFKMTICMNKRHRSGAWAFQTWNILTLTPWAHPFNQWPYIKSTKTIKTISNNNEMASSTREITCRTTLLSNSSTTLALKKTKNKMSCKASSMWIKTMLKAVLTQKMNLKGSRGRCELFITQQKIKANLWQGLAKRNSHSITILELIK